MTKTILFVIIVGLLVTTLFTATSIIVQADDDKKKPKSKVVSSRDNVFVSDLGIDPGRRVVIIDNANMGTLDIELNWRFDPNRCKLQTFDGASFANVVDDDAYGGNPSHAVVSDIEAVFLEAMSSGCSITPNQGGTFVQISVVETKN